MGPGNVMQGQLQHREAPCWRPAIYHTASSSQKGAAGVLQTVCRACCRLDGTLTACGSLMQGQLPSEERPTQRHMASCSQKGAADVLQTCAGLLGARGMWQPFNIQLICCCWCDIQTYIID